MESTNASLGLYLQEARSRKGLSLEEAAIETNIARKYIEALENDEFGFFPAEMYVTGFLSTYVEILELDKAVVLAMYHRTVNKEKEVPLEFLYSSAKSNTSMRSYFLFGVIILPLVLITLGISIILLRSSDPTKDSGVVRNRSLFNTKSSAVSKEIPIDISTVQSRQELTVGLTDRLLLMRDGNIENTIEFLGRTRSKGYVKLQVGTDGYSYKGGDVVNIALSDNGESTVLIEILSVEDKSLKLMLSFQGSLSSIDSIEANSFDVSRYAKSIKNEIVLFPIEEDSVVSLKLFASRPVWVGYQSDQDGEQQGFLDEGKSLEIRFSHGLRLMLSNAGTVTIEFVGMNTVIRGGMTGESSQSILYKKKEGTTTSIYRALLK